MHVNCYKFESDFLKILIYDKTANFATVYSKMQSKIWRRENGGNFVQ